MTIKRALPHIRRPKPPPTQAHREADQASGNGNKEGNLRGPAAHTTQIAEWDRLRLQQRWPDIERLRWAFLLANDLTTCADLIQGRPVAPARLDTQQLARAQQQPLVRLDQRPIDLFPKAA